MNTRNDFSTQEMSQASQTQYFSFADSDLSQDQLRPSWSSLDLAYGQRRLIHLRKPIVIVGRSLNNETVTNSTQFEHFYETDLISRVDYMRTSCKHFTIEKFLRDPVTGFEFNENAAPAIITCNGRNGFLVDTVFLNQNEAIVLEHNSKLRFPKSANLFGIFKYAEGVGHSLPHCAQLMNDYFVGQEIGSGANGSVRVVIPRDKRNEAQNFELKALKSINYASENSLISSDSSTALNAVKNEAAIMKNINHSHVMGLFSEYITDRHVHLVFELMSGGDLLRRIQKSDNKRLSEADSKFFFTQVLSGIRYLHDKDITHRDIKVENILLKDNSASPLVKIADFGLSKMHGLMKTVCGTFLYSAPEILRKATTYTNKVDIWSLGCLLYCCLTGRVPFVRNGNESMKAFSRKVCRADYSTECFDKFKISSDAARTLELTIHPVANQRISAAELQKLYWISDDSNQQRIRDMYRVYGVQQEDDSDNLPSRLEESLVLDDSESRSRRQRPEEDDADNGNGGNVEQQRAKRFRVAK